MNTPRCCLIIATVAASACGRGLEGDPLRLPGSNGSDAAAGDGGVTTVGNEWATGGARLRPVFVVADDGTEDFVGWFDKELGIRCSFERAVDGKLRCLPLPPQPRPQIRQFADAACRAPLLTANDACSGAFGFRYWEDGSVAVYRLGSVSATTTIFERSDAAECIERQLPSGLEVFTLAEPVPPGQFVARATTERRPNPNGVRFDREYAVAEDGSAQFFGLFDKTVGASCELRVVGDGRLRCVPLRSSLAYLATDANCSGLVTWFGGPQDPGDERFAFGTDPRTSGCDFRRTVHVVTGVYDGPIYASSDHTVPRSAGATCTPATRNPSWTYYSVDPTPLPDDTFEAFDRAPSSGRLRTDVHVGATQARTRLPATALSPWPFIDGEQSDIACGFAPAEGGELRCMPRVAEPFFADGDCTQPAFRHYHSVCPPSPTVASIAQGPWCKPTFAAYAVGAELPGAYVRRGGACVSAETSSSFVYRAGAPIAAAQLARAIEQVR